MYLIAKKTKNTINASKATMIMKGKRRTEKINSTNVGVLLFSSSSKI